MRVQLRAGRVIVHGSVALWALDLAVVGLFAATWWFWVPGGQWLALKALGPVAGLAFAGWWLLVARLIIDPEAGEITYLGLWRRSVPLSDVVGVDVVSRIQQRQGVPCLRLRTTRRPIMCRAVGAVGASPVHRTRQLVEKVLASAAPGRGITREEFEEWRLSLPHLQRARRGQPG